MVLVNVQSWFFLKDLNLLQKLVITIAKSEIYRARNAGTKPDVSCFMNNLKLEARKEQISSQWLNNQEAFEKKWGNLKNILD